jgi:hypothetical protein
MVDGKPPSDQSYRWAPHQTDKVFLALFPVATRGSKLSKNDFCTRSGDIGLGITACNCDDSLYSLRQS